MSVLLYIVLINILSVFPDEVPSCRTGHLVNNLGFMDDHDLLNATQSGEQDLLNTAAEVSYMSGLVCNVSKSQFFVDNREALPATPTFFPQENFV